MKASVRIAMLDSGVHTAHPHIGRPPTGGVTILPDGEREGFTDTLGHGTAICALLQQMAPGADLLAVKIFDTRLATSLANVLRAIDWCLERQVNIINLSLGTTNEAHRPFFLTAIERVQRTGAVLVSAFGVEGVAMLPGSLPGVIGVVEDADCPRDEYRVLRDGPLRFAACPYPLDIPGVPRQRNLRGVSFAVAHVSAQIARIWPDIAAGENWHTRLAAAVPSPEVAGRVPRH